MKSSREVSRGSYHLLNSHKTICLNKTFSLLFQQKILFPLRSEKSLLGTRFHRRTELNLLFCLVKDIWAQAGYNRASMCHL